VSIFISYRRSDSPAITGWIDDHLRRKFGTKGVYRDIDSIPPGVDFIEHLTKSLETCDVCLVIIGPAWDLARLSDQHDPVRLELEIALASNACVIPVLVERANLPARELLPASLQPLLRRQATRIDSGSDFGIHISRLVSAIKQQRSSASRQTRLPEQLRRHPLLVGTIVLATLITIKLSLPTEQNAAPDGVAHSANTLVETQQDRGGVLPIGGQPNGIAGVVAAVAHQPSAPSASPLATTSANPKSPIPGGDRTAKGVDAADPINDPPEKRIRFVPLRSSVPTESATGGQEPLGRPHVRPGTLAGATTVSALPIATPSNRPTLVGMTDTAPSAPSGEWRFRLRNARGEQPRPPTIRNPRGEQVE
jgi:hypothetical protein